jgi:ankyrin repeat protein
MRKEKLISIGLLIFMMSLFLTACVENATSEENKIQPKVDLATAVITDNIEAVRTHIDYGSDLNQKDPFSGSTPLITAATFNKIKIAELLIEADVELNATNNDGATALHSAAFFGRIEIVQLLINAKVDKTIKNNFNQTAAESMQTPFEDLKPIYMMLQEQLAPMGLELDLAELEKTRPVIRMMLQ